MLPSFTLPGTGVAVSSYHLFHVMAWFAFYFVGTRVTRSRPDLSRHWLWLAVGLAFCDTVGACVAYQLIHGRRAIGFFAGPLLFAMLTGVYCVARRVRAYPFLDAWAVAFAASHVLEKLACLATGCCYGRSTDSFLGVATMKAHGDETKYLPLPLLEASLHLVTALLLGFLLSRGILRGRLVMILGVMYGAWRFGTETARGGSPSAFLDGPFSVTQVACLSAMVFSSSYLVTSPYASGRAPSPST